MSDIAAYFGSFDPVTRRHIDVARRALDEKQADHIIAVVKPSPSKCHLLERRVAAALFRLALPEDLKDRVSVTVSFCVSILPPVGATKYLRGIRNQSDAICEAEIKARIFKDAAKLSCRPLPVVYIVDEPSIESPISSTHVRNLLLNPDASLTDLVFYVPDKIAQILYDARCEVMPYKNRPETIAAYNSSIFSQLG